MPYTEYIVIIIVTITNFKSWLRTASQFLIHQNCTFQSSHDLDHTPYIPLTLFYTYHQNNLSMCDLTFSVDK